MVRAVFGLQFFIKHSLMGGMFIDKVELFPTLGDDIGLKGLPDQSVLLRHRIPVNGGVGIRQFFRLWCSCRLQIFSMDGLNSPCSHCAAGFPVRDLRGDDPN